MAIKAFAIYNSDFGTQNFVRSGWAEFNQDELTRAVRKEAIKGLEPPVPRLIEDSSGAIPGYDGPHAIRRHGLHDSQVCMPLPLLFWLGGGSRALPR